MRKYVIFITSLVLIYGHSCKKASIGENKVSPALVAAFNYQPGTYWVYKDSISGVFDSFYVYKNEFSQNFDNSSGRQIKNDSYSIYVKQSSPFVNTTESPWRIDLFDYEMDIIYLNKNNAHLQLLLYPYDTDTMQRDYDDTILFIAHPTFFLNGSTYQNVEEIHHSFTLNPLVIYGPAFTLHDIYYINSTVGIVKMRIDHPADSTLFVWELQRYKIVK